jgi:hypothetical protein
MNRVEHNRPKVEVKDNHIILRLTPDKHAGIRNYCRARGMSLVDGVIWWLKLAAASPVGVSDYGRGADSARAKPEA